MKILTPGPVPGLTLHEQRDPTTDIDRKAASLADPQRPAVQPVASPAADARPRAPYEFEESFKAWYRKLVLAVMVAGATLHDAEDAVSKAFERIAPTWKPEKYSVAYVKKAAINNFIKEKIRYGSRVTLCLDGPEHDEHDEGTEDYRLSEWEDEQWLKQILGKLPARQREVMECFVAGLDYKEITEQLDMSREAVRRNICDACKSLRKLLRADGEYRQPDSTPTRSSLEEAR